VVTRYALLKATATCTVRLRKAAAAAASVERSHQKPNKGSKRRRSEEICEFAHIATHSITETGDCASSRSDFLFVVKQLRRAAVVTTIITSTQPLTVPATSHLCGKLPSIHKTKTVVRVARDLHAKKYQVPVGCQGALGVP
jgi:hypothetical protein